jgi:hypothetical protein
MASVLLLECFSQFKSDLPRIKELLNTLPFKLKTIDFTKDLASIANYDVPSLLHALYLFV